MARGRAPSKLLYTVPTFANPTGATLPPARRARLAAVAADARLVLVEDDPYADLRFAGEPVKPVLAHDGASDWTVYLGSLSKIVAPGLRIGWAVAPAAVLRRMTVAKQTSDLCTAPIAQEAIRRYLASGRLAAHLRTIAQTYGSRCRALVSALAQFVPDDVEWREPSGGMFVWARLGGGRDASEVLKRALRAQRDVRAGRGVLRARRGCGQPAAVVRRAGRSGDFRGRAPAARGARGVPPANVTHVTHVRRERRAPGTRARR